MKLQLLCGGLAGLLMLSAACTAHAPTEQAAKPPVAHADPAMAGALAAVEQFSAALKAGNLERAGGLLAEDVLILESGGAEHTRQEYLGGHARHDAAFLKDARISIKQRTARVEGDHAWVGTESDLATTRNGVPTTLSSSETMLLRRSEGMWHIVHIHWSSGARH